MITNSRLFNDLTDQGKWDAMYKQEEDSLVRKPYIKLFTLTFMNDKWWHHLIVPDEEWISTGGNKLQVLWDMLRLKVEASANCVDSQVQVYIETEWAEAIDMTATQIGLMLADRDVAVEYLDEGASLKDIADPERVSIRLVPKATTAQP